MLKLRALARVSEKTDAMNIVITNYREEKNDEEDHTNLLVLRSCWLKRIDDSTAVKVHKIQRNFRTIFDYSQEDGIT